MMSNLVSLEIMEELTVRRGGLVEQWSPGDLVVLPLKQAHQILERVGPKARLIGTGGKAPDELGGLPPGPAVS
jgi:hypothetical protein